MGVLDGFPFLLGGVPAGFLVFFLARRFTLRRDEEDATDESPRRLLPWQTEPWATRLRLAFALLTPFLITVAGARFEPLQAAAVSLLLVALLVCTATDLLLYRVPNAITYPGIALALVAVTVMPGGDLVESLLAMLLGGGGFFVMAVATRGGMGLGDVKLAMLIGASLGLQGGYQALVYGVLAGGLVIFALWLSGLVGRRQALPYAPFLAISAMAVALTQGAAFAPL